jgi:transposase
VVVAATGAVIEQMTVPAAPAGYQQLLQLASHRPGRRVWAIEGTGGDGAGLTRFLHAHTERVVELDRPKRTARRHGATSDALDVVRAAREALSRDQLAQPRAAGHRAALSVRLAARRSAVQAASDGQRQLHALVVAAPDTLRSRLRGLTTPRLVATCGRLRLQTPWDVETIATAASLRALARRVQLLNTEIADHTRAITTLVRAWHPELLTSTGVGPIVAAVVLGAWSHPGRCRTDAAFAMLGGGRPDPGLLWPTGPGAPQPVRRLSTQPGLHVVFLTRLRYDPATRAYAQRRRAEGKTNREIRPCLVRYVARQLYRLLEHGRAAGSAHRGRRGEPSSSRTQVRASLRRLPPSRRARQYQDSHADTLGGVNRLTVVLRPRRHPWLVEVGAR